MSISIRIGGIGLGRRRGNALPDAPTGLAATVFSDTRIDLTFTGTGDVEQSTDGITYSIVASDQTDSYSDIGLTAGNTYYHKITNAGGSSNIVSTYLSTLLTGLVDYWRLDETSGNATGINGNVLINNNTATYVPAVINNGVSFGASNTNKSLTKDSAFGMTYTSSRSISGYIKVINIPGSGNFTFGLFSMLFGVNPGTHSTVVYRRSGAYLQLAIGAGTYNITLTPGERYHIALTYDYAGNSFKLYLNSTLIITTTVTTSDYSAFPSRFAIGNYAGASFASIIADEANMHSRVLTEAEVLEVYASNGYPFLAPGDSADVKLTSASYCWFNSPRALYNAAANKTWVGLVHNDGSGYSQHIVTVNNATGAVSTVKVGSVVEYDDHNEPSILVRASDNRLFIAYTEHALTVGIRYRISTNPLDASAWGAETVKDPGEAASSYTYCNAFQVTNGDIYIFFRETGGGVAYWNYIKSTDGGVTFGDDVRVIHKPYLRCWQNPADKDIIHFTPSHHPNELIATNIVVHCYFDASDETWHKSDGTDVTANIPLEYANMTTIMSNTNPVQGWIEDLFLDASGYPRVLMSYYPDAGSTPVLKKLYYSEWTGAAWSTPYEIHQSLNKNIGLVTLVNTYPPLASFDRSNADRIFAGKEVAWTCEIFEITRVAANNFTSVQKTTASKFDQWRPVTTASPNLNVFWLNKKRYYDYRNDYIQQLVCKTL